MNSGFFERVWAFAARIPPGRVATYGQLALLAGNPRRARAAGAALHRAPDNVPCHRVVNRLGEVYPGSREEFTSRLRAEGVPFLPDGRVDLPKALWLGPGPED